MRLKMQALQQNFRNLCVVLFAVSYIQISLPLIGDDMHNARSAFNAALFAAQGIVDQAFADLDQQFNVLDAQVKALMDQKDARIADVLVTCLSNLPAP